MHKKEFKMADENEAMPLYGGNFHLFSPPKPKRMIQIAAAMVPPNSNSSNSTSSLPALAGEVALAQKNQMSRLEKRIEFLQQVKDDYHEVLRLKALAERDMQAISRKSNLLQDDIELCQTKCEKIQKEIKRHVSETEALKREIESTERELAMEKSNYEEYRRKMKNHKELVEKAESFNNVNKNIEAKRKEIEMLGNEKESLREGTELDKLLSGEAKEIAIAALLTLEETKNELAVSLKKNFQLDEEGAKQSKIRREIDLLQKKYQAQLTWTKKQLQETVTRNKQWSEEASQKEKEIRDLQEKINKY